MKSVDTEAQRRLTVTAACIVQMVADDSKQGWEQDSKCQDQDSNQQTKT